ncbi:HAD family hydrolase [Vibrio taketomensis]|uniref:HAD family hydrolase n=1 Tax=Vibrio taketomensis TaxID=2572923 RepID=UPI00138970FA|nr:HAD family hydrolase [Vibrio taketomensis]
MPRPLYVFDMDDTLINGDCSSIWNQFLVEKGIATQANFLEQDQHLMASYAEGKMNMEDYLKFSMVPLASLPTSTVDALVEECISQYILPKVFPQASSLIAELKREHIDMLIISATVSFVVEAVGSRIGIPHALGIDMKIKNGCYSSEIEGIPSYREGKVARLNDWLAAQKHHYTSVHFYTDSINDLPLCEYADFAYLVNPCPRLRAIANRPNWQILTWA